MYDEYYIKKTDEKNNIIFQKINIENTTILGYKIEDIIRIINGIELEKRTEIIMCMKNLSQYIEMYKQEQEKLQKEFINNHIKNLGVVDDRNTEATNS